MSKRTERQYPGEDSGKLCCPLPFFLQDLCLLAVIRDLDRYPSELLASMPLWLRNRLLKNLPMLDLCRLETTPVARKVDVSAIWNSRLRLEKLTETPQVSRRSLFPCPSRLKKESESGFQLNVGRIDGRTGFPIVRSSEYSPADRVSKEIEAAFQQLKEHTQPGKIDLFIKTVSDILDDSLKVDKSHMESVALKLTSIQGHLILSNMHSGSMCSPSAVTESDSRTVWKRQATALSVTDLSELHSSSQFRKQYPEQVNTLLLTPTRLLTTMITNGQDELMLLSLLTRDCNLQPSSASIHIDSITRSILIELSEERFVLDSGITLPSKQTIRTSIMSNLLRKVAILRLQCDKYTNIGVMISMIHAAIADGKDSQLKHLFCTIPDVYMDVAQPFTALFSLQNFHQLSLVVDEVYPLTLSKLLLGFMTAPCSHTQTLTIHGKKSMFPLDTFRTEQLAALDVGGNTVPDCGTEHKIFQFFPQGEFNNGLYLLFQLPTVRLRKIDLSLCYKYYHLCATHRDLQVKKLVIDTAWASSFYGNTAQEDLVSFFTIHSLQKICIHGEWGHMEEVKSGLVEGLRNRSKSHLPPVRKIALELRIANSYKKRDFEMLCDAIFSLSQLDELKVTLGAGFAVMIRQPGFEVVMYRSWIRNASRIKLKELCFQSYKTELKKLSLITQELSFSSKRKHHPVPRKVYGDPIDFFGSDFLDYRYYYSDPFDYGDDDQFAYGYSDDDYY